MSTAITLPLKHGSHGRICGGNGLLLAECYSGSGSCVDVADEIVRRVNLHDELVAALRESTDLVPRISGDDPMAAALADWLRGVRTVLAKVEAR